MRSIDIHEAKIRIAELVDATKNGDEIVITIAGTPVAKLIPIPNKTRRRPGALKGKITIAKDWDAPLNLY